MPSWLVLLWVLLLPVQINIRHFMLNFAPSDLVLLAYLPYFASTGLRITRGLWHNSLTWLAVCIVLLGNLVAFLTTGILSEWALLNKTVGFLVLMLSYVMVGEYVSAGWERVHGLTRWFVRGVTMHALVALLMAVTGFRIPGLPGVLNAGRLKGFYIDPNAFGGLLVSALVIVLVIYFRDGPLRKPIEGVVSASILAVGAFLTHSRSSWIGLVAGAIIGLMLGKARHRLLGVVLILVLGGVVYLAIPAVVESGQTPEASIWETRQGMAYRQNTIDIRVNMAKDALAMFRQSPIWGNGLGSYLYTKQAGIIHNTFLWLLAELGLLGAAAFVWLIVGHLRRAAYNIRHSNGQSLSLNIGLLCSFVALAGLSIGIEALYQRHWWLVMAMISAAYVMTRRELAASDALGRRRAREWAARAAAMRAARPAGSVAPESLAPRART